MFFLGMPDKAGHIKLDLNGSAYGIAIINQTINAASCIDLPSIYFLAN